MNVVGQFALIAASVAALIGILMAVKFLGRRFAWSAELQRKCVHVATGLYALSLIFTFSDFWPVAILIGLVVAVLLVLRLPRFARSGLGTPLHEVQRRSYGEILLAISVAFVFYFSIGRPVTYVLPMMVLTLSDAAAALVGVNYGRRRFVVETGTKTLEGVAIFFVVTFIVSAVILLLMTDIGRVNVILLSAVVAAIGALIEANSWRGLDNLFVPIALNIFLANHLDTPPLELLYLAGTFAGAMLILVGLAEPLRVTPHAVRAYAILVFAILTVTEPYNAILPVAAIIAHLVAQRSNPSLSPFPDLDFVAAFAIVSLSWLFLGEYLHRNALDVFNLSFAGAALAFLVVARHRWPIVIAAAGAALFVAVLAIAGFNPALAEWEGELLPWAVATFALCLAGPWLLPKLLDWHRAWRVLLLALPVPAAFFLLKGTLF